MKMMKSYLPLEITADILSRLPVDSIIKFKRVCKTWRTLIENDPLFLVAYNNNITAHLRQSSIVPNNSITEVDEADEAAEAQPSGFFMIIEELFCYGEFKQDHLKVTRSIKYPPLPPRSRLRLHHPFYYYGEEEEEETSAAWELLGSSNGLICLSANRLEENNILTWYIYVYNPMTREFVDFGTETHKVIKIPRGGRASGFGYSPSTNEYKVVRIIYETCYSTSGQVKVYTLGSDHGASSRSWRDKGEIPYVISCAGVLVNGALYWTTIHKKILSFDLDDEEFRIVPVPKKVYHHDGLKLLNTPVLGVLRGCLSMTCTDYGYGHESTGRINVWVINNNKKKLYKSNSSSNSTTTATPADDVKQYSWVKLPVILYKPPLINHWVFNKMTSYGLKYESFCRFNYLKSIAHLYLVPYTKSLVSLKALGEDNVKKIQYVSLKALGDTVCLAEGSWPRARFKKGEDNVKKIQYVSLKARRRRKFKMYTIKIKNLRRARFKKRVCKIT